jgi:FxsC-like protein
MGSVGLVIVAVRADEQPPNRTQREYYGSEPEDWRPFRPAVESPAADIARDALSNIAIGDTVSFRLGAGLSADLAHADSEKRVVVVLVDPWAITLDEYREEYREPLENIARRVAGDVLPPAGAVVIFSSTDTETGAQAADLDAALRRWAAPRAMNRRSRLGKVHTDRELAVDVVRVVMRTQSALMGPRSPQGSEAFDTDPHRPILRRRPMGKADPRR